MNSSTQVSIESRMNTIINATNKIPKQMLFKLGTDIEKVRDYLTYVYSENQELHLLNKDLVIRMVIAKHLRTINMKVSNTFILLLVALDKINRNDLRASESVIVAKLINQNREKHDLDIISKIIAQIRTKLPKDLSSRLTHNHINDVKTAIISNMKSIDRLIERYTDIMNMDFSKVTTQDELDVFHMELSKQRRDTGYNAQQLRHKKLNELEAREQELIRAKDLEHINRASEEKIDANYVDREPVLMEDDKYDKIYYYDKYSKTLQRLPNKDELNNVSEAQVEKILGQHDISSEELKLNLDYLKNNKILNMEANEYVFKDNKDFTDRMLEEEQAGNIPSKMDLMTKILIGLVVTLVVILILSFVFLGNKNVKVRDLSKIKNQI
jgi:hypothetical protein